jgi:hypothetical protein
LFVLPEPNKNKIKGDINDNSIAFFEGSAIHVSGFDYDEGYKPAIEEARVGIEKIKKYMQNSPRDMTGPFSNYYKESSGNICEKFYIFKVQCTGYKKAGKKYIEFNFIGDPSGDDWKTNKMMVCDGGWYFWNIMYDVSKKRVYDLRINGVG